VRRSQRSSDLSQLISDLEDGRTTNNKLYLSLNLFIDGNRVLRSKSRLSNIRTLPYDTRFPMVLLSTSQFTRLLVHSYHVDFEHTVSIDTVKSKLKTLFHIVGLENLLRSIRGVCLLCIKRRIKRNEQQMSSIPEYRFSGPLRAFNVTGLDFAGPFEIKQGRGRARVKNYILVLTCLQTRALHLEVTDSMDTRAVVNAISRFIDVRGMPSEILSDNFSTFASPEKELEGWVRFLDTDGIIKSTKANINWRFTPPRGPHHGGVYEIMVKATKRALKTLCGHSDLDSDEFRTFVSRVASLINGRPLSKVYGDENKFVILTPNHFLHGSLGGAVGSVKMDHKQRWKLISTLIEHFWKIFIREYLPELRRMQKWKVVRTDLKPGELVLETNPDTPVGQWKIARVMDVIRSKDGLVRKCLIRHSNHEYLRPIVNLCPLGIEGPI
jgi:hypothetical protein